MPKRHDTHIVRDQATSKVQDICNQCGWANEVVHQDYGDDIHVQPSLNGEIDHNHIWIQVKGTRDLVKNYYTSKHGFSMRVSYGHILKWVRSADLTIVVMWDVEKNWGLWSMPKYAVDAWDLRSLMNSRSRLVFQKDDRFDVQQLQKIGWRARVDHYFALISNTRSSERHDYDELSSRSATPLIALDFLRLIGVVNDTYLKTDTVVHTRQGRAENVAQYQEFLNEGYVQKYQYLVSELQLNNQNNLLDKFMRTVDGQFVGEKGARYLIDVFLQRHAAKLMVRDALRTISNGCDAQPELYEACGDVVFNLLNGFDPTRKLEGQDSFSDWE